MGLRRFFIFGSLFVSATVFGQNQERDSSYIQSFPEKITARLGLINTSNTFFINDQENNLSYLLTPNTRDYLGVSLLYRSIEIDIGFLPSFLKKNKDNGDSKLFNLNMRMFLGQFMQTIDIYSQEGFFAELNGSNLAFPGVRTFKIGGATSYIFNPNFSFRAVGFQNEWQRKSAGSFIPRLIYYYTTYDLEQNDFSSNASSFDIALSPSYFYNFVVQEHFIIGLGVSAGMGLNRDDQEEQVINSVLYEFGGRISLGYNSETLFAGINSSLTVLEHNSRRVVRVDDTINFFEFYIGYRFNAPKSLNKFADEVNETLGLK